jgi:hypothetical protein
MPNSMTKIYEVILGMYYKTIYSANDHCSAIVTTCHYTLDISSPTWVGSCLLHKYITRGMYHETFLVVINSAS